MTVNEPAQDVSQDAPQLTFSEQLADQLGGVRGIVESGLPVLIFVVVNIAWSLRPAVVISFRSSSVFSTPAPCTPRISMISGAVIGCL